VSIKGRVQKNTCGWFDSYGLISPTPLTVGLRPLCTKKPLVGGPAVKGVRVADDWGIVSLFFMFTWGEGNEKS
ncbi:hypothetical protein, partial [Schleiferilactobacillus harbinensis]|uniref:hypothetical protein n=1 Tax=Schleiferilactobacillus harbinensis TaxID=304207 RepID=UPI0039EB8D4E